MSIENIDSNESKLIKAFYDNGLLFPVDYHIALEKGLYKCKLKTIKKSAFQYVVLQIDDKLKSKQEEKEICDKFCDFLTETLFSVSGHAQLLIEQWAFEFTSIFVEPIRNIKKEDVDYSYLIVKINYIYSTNSETIIDDMNNYYSENYDSDEVSNICNDLKNGLELFFEETFYDYISDFSSGSDCPEENLKNFYTEIIGDNMDNEMPDIGYVECGNINENCCDKMALYYSKLIIDENW